MLGLILIISGLLANHAGASELSSNTFDDATIMRADDVYIEAMKICNADPRMGDDIYSSPLLREVFVDSTAQTFNALGFFDMGTSAIQLINDDGLSRTYKDLVEYPPFQLALEDCYPHDAFKQNYFVHRLLVQDVLGKVTGAAGVVGLTVAITATFNTVTKLMTKVVPRFGRYFRRLTFAGGLLIGFDMVRRRYFKTTEEHNEMLKVLRDQFARGPQERAAEELQLYDHFIQVLQEKLNHLPLSDPKYQRLSNLLSELRQRRPSIEARMHATG